MASRKRKDPKPVCFADKYLGRVNETELSKLTEDVRTSAERKSRLTQDAMSPPGALRLPPLLEQRRLDFGITDGAFAFQPFHDKILIHQIPAKPQTYDRGGLLIKTEVQVAKEENECPVGIIVGAGATALDELRANGFDLGHIVLFQRLAPWRHETDYTYKQQKVIVLRTGDLIGSVDLGDAMRRGDVEVVFNEESYEHLYQAPETKQMWRPATVKPFVSGDQ